MSSQSLYSVERFPSGTIIPATVLDSYRSGNREMLDRASRFMPLYAEHIEASNRMILETANGLSGNALIIGLGNGMEIPIQELTDQFYSITSVELDESGVAKTVGSLAETDQAKHKIVIEDVSGVLKQVADLVNKEVSINSNNPVAFLRQVVAGIEAINPNYPQLGQKYNLVLSSLIASQLVSMPYEYALSVVSKAFGPVFSSMLSSRLDLLQALSGLTFRSQENHIDFLSRIVENGGRVYFSDTVTETFLGRDSTGNPVPISQPLPMFDMGTLSRNIYARFDILKQESWRWYRQPPMPGLQGSIFQILGTILQPK